MAANYTNILVGITVAQRTALEDAAKAEGSSMAAIVRDAIEHWLRMIGPVDESASGEAESLTLEVA